VRKVHALSGSGFVMSVTWLYCVLECPHLTALFDNGTQESAAYFV